MKNIQNLIAKSYPNNINIGLSGRESVALQIADTFAEKLPEPKTAFIGNITNDHDYRIAVTYPIEDGCVIYGDIISKFLLDMELAEKSLKHNKEQTI